MSATIARVVFEDGGDIIVQLGQWAHRFELKYADQAAVAVVEWIRLADESEWSDNQPSEHGGPDGSCRVWDLLEDPKSWLWGLGFLSSRRASGWENEREFFKTLMMELNEGEVD